MARNLRTLLALPLIVAACAVFGGHFGSQVEAVASAAAADPAAPPPERDTEAFLRTYALVARNSAEAVNPAKAIYKGAIPGMLQTLDPHSSFYDQKDYRMLIEDQRGRYSGVGMHVGARNDKTVVIAPFPGSPAYRVGLRPGDVIQSVDGRLADGLTTSEVADMLKGSRGTTVVIRVTREGTPEPLSFSIVREDINRKTVSDAFWV
jgi:carboxyl-terminal processing protease